MKRILKIVCLPVVAFMMALSVAMFSGAAHAEDNTPNFRLQVSPTQVNLGLLEPGQSYTGKLYVQNTGKYPYTFTAEVSPYSVTNMNYDADFSTTTKYTEIANWITLSTETGTVQPNQSYELQYTVNVPADAPGSGQNASIVITMASDTNTESTGITTQRRVGFLMYSNVNGESVETGEIIKNELPRFFFNPPVVATSVVKNTGNMYAVARYYLEVKGLFGDKVIYTTETEQSDGSKTVLGHYIFPETERYSETTWENAPIVGIYRVKHKITIYDEVSEINRVIFLCPIWLLLIILIFIAAVVFWITSRIMKRRQEKR